MSFFKTLHYAINVFRNVYSDFTKSYEVKKKFSDVAKYVRSKDFMGHSIAGQAKKDSDLGTMWIYEYNCAGSSGREASRFKVSIQHYQESIISMEISLHSNLPEYELDKAMEKLQKTLPDYEPEVKELPKIEKIDYSKFSIAELLDQFDKATATFGENPNEITFAPMVEIRKAIGNQIDAKPLAKRGKYGNALKNIDMYISTIKTQLSSPATAALIGQFVGNYVAEIRSSIGELAGLLG